MPEPAVETEAEPAPEPEAPAVTEIKPPVPEPEIETIEHNGREIALVGERFCVGNRCFRTLELAQRFIEKNQNARDNQTMECAICPPTSLGVQFGAHRGT